MRTNNQADRTSARFPIARLLLVGVLLTGVAISVALAVGFFNAHVSPPDTASVDRQLGGMVLIPGGRFRMGDDFSVRPDERPAREITIDPFWMDEHEVTNRQFAEFVDQTGYVTTAETLGRALVFDRDCTQWVETEGANWRHPAGPDTWLDGLENHPAVQVSWYDAQAYAQWAGKRLPTEAQWEYAARAGLRDADYPWGREELVEGRYQANYYQGWYPDEDIQADGFDRLAPVKSFPANQFALYDLSGNAWEWCRDWYADDYYRSSPDNNPGGPRDGTMRVQRGGSWLSAENYRPGYKVSTRWRRSPEACYQDVGFRCARNEVQ